MAVLRTYYYSFTIILISLINYNRKVNCDCNYTYVEDYGDYDLSKIICQDFKNYNELKNGLIAIADKEYVDSIIINRISQLPYFPSEILTDLTELSTIILSEVTIPFWKSIPNRGQDYGNKMGNIETLEFKSVIGVSNWNWAELAQLFDNNVVFFIAENCRWPKLQSDLSNFFQNGVEYITIKNCSLRWLDDDSLNCRNCRSIVLNDNDITELRGSVFGQGPKELQQLELSNNKLTKLPTDLFAFMKDKYEPLREFKLKLIGNPIVTLEKETFEPIIVVIQDKIHIEINESGNVIVLECDCRLKWLKDYQFDISNNLCVARVDPDKSLERDLRNFLDSCT